MVPVILIFDIQLLQDSERFIIFRIKYKVPALLVVVIQAEISRNQ